MQDSSFLHSRCHAAKPRFQWWEEIRCWTPKNGDEGSRVVARKQCPASVMVWAAVTESGRSPSFLLIKGWNWASRTIEMTSLLVHCCSGYESTSKTVPSVFSRTLHHHRGPERLRRSFQRMVRTLLSKRNRPNLPPIYLNHLEFGI